MMICPKAKECKMCGDQPHCAVHEYNDDCDYSDKCCPSCVELEEVKMERVEYQGKTYEKVKSLAPVEVLKEIKTECEKRNFDMYCSINHFFDDFTLNMLLQEIQTPSRSDWLPWLLSHGFIREVKDEREEHLRLFREQFNSFNTKAELTMFWDWFDHNPIPKKEK